MIDSVAFEGVRPRGRYQTRRLIDALQLCAPDIRCREVRDDGIPLTAPKVHIHVIGRSPEFLAAALTFAGLTANKTAVRFCFVRCGDPTIRRGHESFEPPGRGTRTMPKAQARHPACAARAHSGCRRAVLRPSRLPPHHHARICREAGVSPGALYVYFDSKEALIAGICERDRQGVCRALRPSSRRLPTSCRRCVR